MSGPFVYAAPADWIARWALDWRVANTERVLTELRVNAALDAPAYT